MELSRSGQYSESFLHLFCTIFDTKDDWSIVDVQLTAFSFHVVLEGLRSLVIENNLASTCAVGSPTRQHTHHAMGKIYRQINISSTLNSIGKSEALLRWHATNLDAAVNSTWLCSAICYHFGIVQNVLGGLPKTRRAWELLHWTSRTEARVALLHASAIRDILTEIPLGHVHAIHIPGSLFAAATIYCSFLLAGSTTISVPKVIDWKEIMLMDLYSSNDNEMLGSPDLMETDSKKFLRGTLQDPSAISKNLLYELNHLQMCLRCLCQQWGVCSEMETVLEQ